MTIIDRKTADARVNPRGREIHIFHAGNDDALQRMVNAVLPGSYIRPHRHSDPPRDESVVILRGAMAFIAFDDQGTPEPPGLLLDSYPGPLGQVLINLVNNAVVHAFEGGATGSVHIGAASLGPERVQLWVADDGRGIAPEHLRQVFDPFFTTRLGQGGSGLGLHIVYTLVTGLLGGRIDVHSLPGQGARFLVELPRMAPRAAADSPAAAAPN